MPNLSLANGPHALLIAQLLASASASSGSRPRKKRAVGSSGSVAQTVNPAGNLPSPATALEESVAECITSETESPAIMYGKLQDEETRASAELAAARAHEVEAFLRSDKHEKEISVRREEARLAREARAQDMATVKDMVLARGESPDSKNHRKMTEAKDAETRRVEAEARASEISTNRAFQMKMLEMLAMKS